MAGAVPLHVVGNGPLFQHGSGPIVVSEWDKLPWTAIEFRRWWRIVADACGIPREVRNMDSRAGAITEASDAGADLEHIRHAATHSNISMTQRYSRGAEGKIAAMRAAGMHVSESPAQLGTHMLKLMKDHGLHS